MGLAGPQERLDELLWLECWILLYVDRAPLAGWLDGGRAPLAERKGF